MRLKLREWQLVTYDSGFIPEFERNARAAQNKTTIYQMAQDQKLYDLPAYLDAADLALAKNEENKPKLLELLKSKDSGLRYWGTVGLLLQGKVDAEIQTALESVLNDSCIEVVGIASFALLQAGKNEKASAALIEQLKNNSQGSLFALNVLDWSQTDIKPFANALGSLKTNGNPLAEYEQRMIEYLSETNGLSLIKQPLNKKKNK